MSVEQVADLDERGKSVIESCRMLALHPDWTLKLDARLLTHRGLPMRNSLNAETSETWPGGAELIPELRGMGLKFVEKKQRSCFPDSELLTTLLEWHIEELVICGINT